MRFKKLSKLFLRTSIRIIVMLSPNQLLMKARSKNLYIKERKSLSIDVPRLILESFYG
jgi:hypothetical protein